MNKEWSEEQKEIKILLKKKETYEEGIETLIDFRQILFDQITSVVTELPAEQFYQRPFPNAKGYQSKTIAYSIWHIFRIEDIVSHTLIQNNEQILFTGDYQKKMNAPVITTGNELQGVQLEEFSQKLDYKVLYEYAREVMLSTNQLLKELNFSQMRQKFTDVDRQRLTESGCVSMDEDAVWLIDYWCKKDIRGLIGMPFSRHWISHIEALIRIQEKLNKPTRKRTATAVKSKEA